MIYGLIHADRDEMALGAAGHPYPVMLDDQGEGKLVDTARGLILGAGGSARRQVTIPFHRGQTLLMYTDGLVERRFEDLALGKQRLLEVATRHGLADLPSGLRELADMLRDTTRDDDLAVLAVRRT
jgi:serine phosphatase RsbU (regulator of sigma subunit)